jgi:hypothetical protein
MLDLNLARRDLASASSNAQLELKSEIDKLREELDQANSILQEHLKTAVIAYNSRPCDPRESERFWDFMNRISELTRALRVYTRAAAFDPTLIDRYFNIYGTGLVWYGHFIMGGSFSFSPGPEFNPLAQVPGLVSITDTPQLPARKPSDLFFAEASKESVPAVGPLFSSIKLSERIGSVITALRSPPRAENFPPKTKG